MPEKANKTIHKVILLSSPVLGLLTEVFDFEAPLPELFDVLLEFVVPPDLLEDGDFSHTAVYVASAVTVSATAGVQPLNT